MNQETFSIVDGHSADGGESFPYIEIYEDRRDGARGALICTIERFHEATVSKRGTTAEVMFMRDGGKVTLTFENAVVEYVVPDDEDKRFGKRLDALMKSLRYRPTSEQRDI